MRTVILMVKYQCLLLLNREGLKSKCIKQIYYKPKTDLML